MRYKIATKHEQPDARQPDERTKRAAVWDDGRGADAVALGLPFGGHLDGRDTDGEAFAPGTDVWLKIGDVVPVTYYHGFGPDDPAEWQEPPQVIGAARYTKADERGHWFDLQLYPDGLGVRVIDALQSGGEVKASSGAVSHLVRTGQDGIVQVWPVGELAVFDTNDWRRPANELAIVQPATAAQGEGVADVVIKSKTKPEGAEIMDEKKAPVVEQPEPVAAQPQPPALDVDALVSAVQDAAKSAATEAVSEFAAKFRLDSTGAAKSPAVIQTRGDSFVKAAAAWVRTGQPVSGLPLSPDGRELSLKASNPVDMVVGTNTAGGYAAPDDFFNAIIAKAGEMRIADRLGVRRIPGRGTTVLVPTDANTSGGEFQNTAEGGTYDKDTPTLGQVSMTLSKYTKDVPLSEELLDDEDANLLGFLVDYVGRGVAITHNSLLLTEVAANGTSFKTFASNSAIAAGEVEDILYNDTIANYIDDGGSLGWVMRLSTYGSIVSLQGNPFLYDATPQGGGRTLRGYPVAFSSNADAIGSTAKSVYFGNWYYVGMREPGGLSLLRDPYSGASTGQVHLWYSFRTCYKVLQADAVGYGVHPV